MLVNLIGCECKWLFLFLCGPAHTRDPSSFSSEAPPPVFHRAALYTKRSQIKFSFHLSKENRIFRLCLQPPLKTPLSPTLKTFALSNLPHTGLDEDENEASHYWCSCREAGGDFRALGDITKCGISQWLKRINFPLDCMKSCQDRQTLRENTCSLHKVESPPSSETLACLGLITGDCFYF